MVILAVHDCSNISYGYVFLAKGFIMAKNKLNREYLTPWLEKVLKIPATITLLLSIAAAAGWQIGNTSTVLDILDYRMAGLLLSCQISKVWVIGNTYTLLIRLKVFGT